MNNLVTRALSGAVYVALICGAVIAGGWCFVALVSLLGALALNEFFGLSNAPHGGERKASKIVDIVGGMILIICPTVNIPGCAVPNLSAILLFLFLLYLLLRPVMQIYSREKSPLTNIAYAYMGVLYIAMPLASMSFYYSFVNGGYLLLAMFVMIWLSDTGAYLVGSMIGRHKLIPRISPGKTWEGFIGGVVFSVGSAFIFKLGFPGIYSDFSLPVMCGLGLLVALFATWGDLVESLIKRTLGVKDSGSIMPGHGGILDRIDSLLLVAPASIIYLLTAYFCFM